jgi:hypothetical protein
MIHRGSGFQKQLPTPSLSPPACLREAASAKAGESGKVNGNYLEFSNKYAENLFAMVRNEPEHLLNEFLRHNTR